MGGGLMQLVAYGAQDIYLTGNPQITFFKVVYRRHTNFSMETIAQTFSGTGKIGSNINTATATISRNGDLIHKMYINCETPSGSDSTRGSEIVQTAELEIGGQKIDKHWASWNNIWNELSTPESKAIGLKSMQGDVGITGASKTGVSSIQVPLNFWFCRNPGLALPLIALQYHEVKVQFGFGTTGTTKLSENDELKLMVDYIYLDTDERRRFAQVSHEYLIEQIQKQDIVTSSTSQKLIFNHPVKELIWTTSSYTTAQLKLNGHDRFSEQKPEYFQLRQPFDYHSAVPRQNLPSATRTTLGLKSSGSLTNAAVSTHDSASYNHTTFVFTASNGTVAAIEAAAGVASGALSNETILITVAGTDGSLGGGSGSGKGSVFVGQLNAAATASGEELHFVNAPVAENGTTLKVNDGAGTDNLVQNDIVTFSVIKDSVIDEARTSQMTEKINVYSFALKPEEHQPSGTCNFSRIDTAILDLKDYVTTAGEIYAVNYNVLRIMSGMGGLAYSN